MMEIDNHPGDEADVESEGKSSRASTEHRSESTRSRRKSNQPPKTKSPSPAPSVQVLDDEEEEIADGDEEETFAVETVLNHKFHKLGNVRALFSWMLMVRVKGELNI
jgi:hypothetical protein